MTRPPYTLSGLVAVMMFLLAATGVVSAVTLVWSGAYWWAIGEFLATVLVCWVLLGAVGMISHIEDQRWKDEQR